MALPPSGSMIPVKCVIVRPDASAVRFAGVAIHVSMVCGLTNIHESSLSRFFSGQRSPSIDKVTAIAEALGMRVDFALLEFNRIRRAFIQARKAQQTA